MAELGADNLRLTQSGNDIDLSDEPQDFRILGIFSKSDQSTIPKRGEKDFEPDGTDLQERILADSRQAMHDALCGERKHTSKGHVRATWRSGKKMAEIHESKGPHFKSMGQADSKGTIWLLPEETIYMVERGSMECWWEDGVPMSVQGVYASCLGACQGIERYQVYAYLRRAGYIVQRAPCFLDDDDKRPVSTVIHSPTSVPPGLFRYIFSRLFGEKSPPPNGPMLAPWVYRTWDLVYERLSLISSHHPPTTSVPLTSSFARPPFRVAYNVWKPLPSFRKSHPPPPDFRIVVTNARQTGIPTLQELAALMESVPTSAFTEGKSVFQKLKDGCRNVVIAVVDSGVTSFMKFSDVGFGDEPMYKRRRMSTRGGKYGARGGRGGRSRGGSRGGGGGGGQKT